MKTIWYPPMICLALCACNAQAIDTIARNQYNMLQEHAPQILHMCHHNQTCQYHCKQLNRMLREIYHTLQMPSELDQIYDIKELVSITEKTDTESVAYLTAWHEAMLTVLSQAQMEHGITVSNISEKNTDNSSDFYPSHYYPFIINP